MRDPAQPSPTLPDAGHCSLSQGSSEFLFVKMDSAGSSNCFLFDNTGVSMNAAWSPDFTWPYQPFLSLLFSLSSGWEHLLKACSLLCCFRRCSGLGVSLQGCAHHPLITHLQPQLTNPCRAVGLPCAGCTVSHHSLSVSYLFCSPWFIWLLHLFISHDISRLGLYVLTHNTNGISLSSLHAIWVILFFLSWAGARSSSFKGLIGGHNYLGTLCGAHCAWEECGCFWRLHVYRPKWVSWKPPCISLLTPALPIPRQLLLWYLPW